MGNATTDSRSNTRLHDTRLVMASDSEYLRMDIEDTGTLVATMAVFIAVLFLAYGEVSIIVFATFSLCLIINRRAARKWMIVKLREYERRDTE